MAGIADRLCQFRPRRNRNDEMLTLALYVVNALGRQVAWTRLPVPGPRILRWWRRRPTFAVPATADRPCRRELFYAPFPRVASCHPGLASFALAGRHSASLRNRETVTLRKRGCASGIWPCRDVSHVDADWDTESGTVLYQHRSQLPCPYRSRRAKGNGTARRPFPTAGFIIRLPAGSPPLPR